MSAIISALNMTRLNGATKTKTFFECFECIPHIGPRCWQMLKDPRHVSIVRNNEAIASLYKLSDASRKAKQRHSHTASRLVVVVVCLACRVSDY